MNKLSARAQAMVFSPAQPPPDDNPLPPLLAFFRALAEPERLRIAGAISEAALTVGEVAAATGLSLATVHKHLQRLESAGLLATSGAGAEARSQIDGERLRALAATVLDSPRARALAGARDERSRALAAFFRDGRLVQWPAGEKRQRIVLAEISRLFASERVYSEREVNALLTPLFDDYTTLRRALVDYHFLTRQDGVYWRVDRTP